MKIQPVGIIGGGVPPGSPNPDPILDFKKCHFSHPLFQTWPLKSIPGAHPVHTHSQTQPLRL